MRAFIIGAGSMSDTAFYKRIKIEDTDMIICADGGYDHAKLLGLLPTAVIGDFDSIRNKVPESVKIVRYPTEKDKTDMHLCVDYALENGAEEIILLGALGGRTDHSLANIILLRYINDFGAEGMIVNKDCRISVCTESSELERIFGRYVSLIPLTDKVEGVTTEGLKYPLKDHTMTQTENLGISNEFLDSTAKITVKSGVLIIICEN